MSSLADLPEVVGFFAYAREDDENSKLSALRECIQSELLSQLGRSKRNFRIWQDKEAIPAGRLWEAEIKLAVEQSIFFLPIITPRAVASAYCQWEFEAFLLREAELGRDDLVFPILYIRVPGLEDSSQWQKNLVLSMIAKRQYADWCSFRHLDVTAIEFRQLIERFCANICDALRRPWVLPEERKAQEKAAAHQRAEAERERQQAEAKRREDEAWKQAEQVLVRQRADEEQRKREAEAQWRRIVEADAKRRAEEAGQRAVEAQSQEQADEVYQRQEAEAKRRLDEEARRKPEYWLRRVDAERRLTAGDQPLILISFASEDQKWVDDLRTFIDPKIELLRAEDGEPYHLWNFSDAKRGTTPGDEFPEIVAEKMWRCRASIILFSSHYFKSDFCKSIELPFLMWRRDHHKLMCLPIRLGTLPYDKIRVPDYQCDARYVYLKELIDDRQAAVNFAGSRYRDLTLRQLREGGIESEIEDRFAGIAHHVAEFLKAKFSAVEIG
jgi:hypothetical protein